MCPWGTVWRDLSTLGPDKQVDLRRSVKSSERRDFASLVVCLPLSTLRRISFRQGGLTLEEGNSEKQPAFMMRDVEFPPEISFIFCHLKILWQLSSEFVLKQQLCTFDYPVEMICRAPVTHLVCDTIASSNRQRAPCTIGLLTLPAWRAYHSSANDRPTSMIVFGNCRDSFAIRKASLPRACKQIDIILRVEERELKKHEPW